MKKRLSISAIGILAIFLSYFSQKPGETRYSAVVLTRWMELVAMLRGFYSTYPSCSATVDSLKLLFQKNFYISQFFKSN
jgi:hypothetical protein